MSCYQVCVGGAWDRVASAFEDLEVAPGEGGVVLTGPIPDQAALSAVLARIEALELDVVWIRAVGGGR